MQRIQFLRVTMRRDQGVHLLGRFFHSSELFELGHFLLNALQAVGEVTVIQTVGFPIDPLQKIGHQRLVALLHLVSIQQTAQHL